MAYQIKIAKVISVAERHAFYPIPKYIGRVENEEGKTLAETGRCKTRNAAYAGATKLAEGLAK